MHGIIAETTITTLLLPIEIKKMLVQMGSFEVGIRHHLKAYMRCYFPALLRDSIFFISHSLTYNVLMYGDYYLTSLFRSSEFTPPPVLTHINLVNPSRRERKEILLYIGIFRFVYPINKPSWCFGYKACNSKKCKNIDKFRNPTQIHSKPWNL